MGNRPRRNMAVKIVVDSASDIGEKEAKERGIVMVPMMITFGDEEFYDGVTLTTEQFYEKLVSSKELPKTSLVNEFRWSEVFAEHTKNGDELVVITISSKLSGTYNAAVDASKKFENVYVVDSLNACAGERLVCEYAMQLASTGLSAKEIATMLDATKTKIKLYAMIGTLEYLKKGGRISSAVAFAGTLLSLKPVISVDGGEVKVIGKAMGAKNAKAMVNKFAAETTGVDTDKPFTILYSGTDRSIAERYAAEQTFLGENPPISALGATIGTHIGPGAIGLTYFEK